MRSSKQAHTQTKRYVENILEVTVQPAMKNTIGIVKHDSEHFICIPLPFPLLTVGAQETVTMANKLSRLINEGAGSQGASGYGQCLLRNREHFSHAEQHADTHEHDSQSECWCYISNAQRQCHTHIYSKRRRQLISVMFVLFFPVLGSAAGW